MPRANTTTTLLPHHPDPVEGRGPWSAIACDVTELAHWRRSHLSTPAFTRGEGWRLEAYGNEDPSRGRRGATQTRHDDEGAPKGASQRSSTVRGNAPATEIGAHLRTRLERTLG